MKEKLVLIRSVLVYSVSQIAMGVTVVTIKKVSEILGWQISACFKYQLSFMEHELFPKWEKSQMP